MAKTKVLWNLQVGDCNYFTLYGKYPTEWKLNMEYFHCVGGCENVIIFYLTYIIKYHVYIKIHAYTVY